MKTAIFFFLIFCFNDRAQAHAEDKPSLADRERTYQQYCAPCHGYRGEGNGFNARNLDPRPANHTDAVFMSKKTDNELYEAISGGGRAVGKAAIMPPWGNTLDKAQIKSLVRHLRKLCGCKGD